MSAVETVVTKPIADDDRLARRNALVLALAQALAGGNNTVIVATSAIVGAMYAPDRGLATLPITMMVIGMWVGTLPVGYLARRYGRRFALQAGTVFQNRCDYLDPALPWTGWKESGIGSTLSAFGFLHLTRRKSLHFRTSTG